jgi:hypothetical protein
MAIAVKLDDLLHDRRMTLTELADRKGRGLKPHCCAHLCRWDVPRQPTEVTHSIKATRN